MSMTKDKSRPRRSRLAWWRFGIQTGFLVAWLGPFLPRLHSFCGVAFHCHSCPLALFACPIGVLAQFSAIQVFPFVAVGVLLAVGAVAGSFVCGWACPFGFLQDVLAKVPTPKLRLPAWLTMTRYLVLAGLVLAIPFLFGEEHPGFFCKLCPAGALEASAPNVVRQAVAGNEIPWPSPAKVAILGAVLSAAVFVWRPWCTLLCPLGAIYALCNRFSFFFLRFHPQRCAGCAECRSLCRGGDRPLDRVDTLRCVRCLECKQCRSVTVETSWRREPASALAVPSDAENRPGPTT